MECDGGTRYEKFQAGASACSICDACGACSVCGACGACDGSDGSHGSHGSGESILCGTNVLGPRDFVSPQEGKCLTRVLDKVASEQLGLAIDGNSKPA